MQPYSVFIAMSSRTRGVNLKKALEQNGVFKVTGFAFDGKAANERLREKQCDLYIVDYLMQYGDGLFAAELIRELYGEDCAIIMIAPSERLEESALRSGVDHIFTEPFGTREFLRRAELLAKTKKHPFDKADAISRELLKLGMHIGIKGYTMVYCGIAAVLKDATLLSGITTRLYPLIAERTSSSPTCVERNIRHAIEQAWNCGNMKYIDSVFSYSIDAMRGKPTNSAFIATIADKVRMENSITN